MIGARVLITASALDPRRSHISAASRFRIRFTDALLGLISSFRLRYSRTWKPRKQKPSVRWTMRVLSSLKASPLGSSQAASRCLTSSACSRLWHIATRSSAYLTSTGLLRITVPAWMPLA